MVVSYSQKATRARLVEGNERKNIHNLGEGVKDKHYAPSRLINRSPYLKVSYLAITLVKASLL